MEQYNKYKDSGITWLGMIPEHWEVIRNKFLFRESDERNTEKKYQLLSFSKTKGIIPFSEINDKEASSDDLSNYKVLHRNQLLENRMQAWNGMFGVSNIEGCVSPDYSVFNVISDKVNIDFIGYLFKSSLYIERWANASKGIGTGFNRLYTPQFNNVECLLPPISEQQSIASYLNDITVKIDNAINQQQKIIDLLNERKQIIIQKAATKGLNPNVTMKDSSIDWIGEIPKHWTIKRNKYIWSEYTELSASGNETLLSVSQYDGITPSKGSRSEEFVGYKIVRPNSFVSNIMLAWMGGFAVSDLYGIVSPAYCTYMLKTDEINPKYLEFLYKTPQYLAEFARKSSGIIPSRWRLYTDDFGSIWSILPPRDEQDKIVNSILEQIEAITPSLNLAKQKIELLKERKQIIINEVVTGKIKIS